MGNQKTLTRIISLFFSLLFFGFFFLPSQAFAADRYWVGGTATWDGTAGTKWATTSNGAGGAAVPTGADDVYFDSASGAVTVTTSGTTTDVARSVDFNGFTGTLSHAASTTITIGDATAGQNNIALRLVSGMTYTRGNAVNSRFSFVSTSATQQTVATGTKAIGDITFNGATGSWILSDALTSGGTITLTAGTLNLNGQTISAQIFNSNNSNTRTLTMGAASVSLSSTGNAWNINTSSGLTLTANSSSVTLTGAGGTFAGGAMTYNNLSFTVAGAFVITGANTFANITRTGTAVKTDSLSFGANQTITSTLTLTGNSAINRLGVFSSTPGTVVTLTAAAVSLSNINFQDITGAGAASPFTGTSIAANAAMGDSNITQTTPVTRYWVAGSGGNWGATSSWSTSPGGASGASIPLVQDTAVFNSSSITSGNRTINVDMSVGNLDFTGVTNSPKFGNNTFTGFSIYGSITLVAGMTMPNDNASWVLASRTGGTITTNAVALDGSWQIAGPGGTYTLQDNITLSTGSGGFIVTDGTFSAGSSNVTAKSVSHNTQRAKTINMGSGTWTLASTGTVVDFGAQSGAALNLTLNAETSTIVVSSTAAGAKSFDGGGKTFNIVTFGGDNITVLGSNTYATLNVNTAGCTTGLIFTAGTTQTVTSTFATNGDGVAASCGTHGTAKLLTTSAGSAATLSKASGTVSVDYMSLKDSAAAGGAAWYAGANSTSVSGNTGWTFAAPGTITISGTVYSDEGTSALATTPTVRIKINGAGSYSAAANGSGVYSIASITAPVGGDVVTVFLDGASEKATTVTLVGASGNISSIDLYQNEVIARHENSGPLTNTNMGQYDNDDDGDINFTSNAGTLTVLSTDTLYIRTGKTFTPGGSVTTPKLKIVGTMNAGSGTITVTSSGTPFSTGGTFNANTSTFIFNSTSATTLSARTYNNFSLTPAGSVTYTFPAGTTTVGGNFIVGDATNALSLTAATSNPTLNVTGTTLIAASSTLTTGSNTATLTGALTVNGTLTGSGAGTVICRSDVVGTGTVNMSTGTFEQRVTASSNFGTTSGSNNWSFTTLTFGNTGATSTITTQTGGSGTISTSTNLNIGKSGDTAVTTLDAGNRTWIIPTQGGTVLVFNASSVLSGNTSTFRWTGNGANITATSSGGTGTTYYNLELKSSGSTALTFLSGTYAISNLLTIGDGSHAGATAANNPTINAGSITVAAGAVFTSGTGTITISGTGTPFTITGTFTVTANNTVNYTGNGATIVCTGASYSNLGLKPSSSSQQVLCTASSQTLTVNKAFTVGDGTNSGATAATNNPTIDLIGDVTIAANAVYTKGSGTTTLKAGTTQAWSDSTAGQDLGAVVVAVNGTPTTVNITGTVAATTLTINASQALSLNGSNTLILTGTSTPFVNNNTFTYSTGTVRYTGNGATVTALSGTAGTNGYYNLELKPSSSSQQVMGSGTLEVNNNLTIGDGTNTGVTFATNNNTINLRGDLTIAANATVTKGNATTTFKKGGSQTWTDSTSGQDLGTVVIAVNGSDSTVLLSGTPSAASLTINSSQTLNFNGSNTLKLTGTGTPFVNNGSLTISTGTFSYSGATANLNAMTYYNLTLGSGNYTAPAGTLTLNGSFTNNGTYTHNNGTFVVTPATATSAIQGTSGTNFYNFTSTTPNKTINFKNGATFGFYHNLTLTGSNSSGDIILGSTSNGSQWTIYIDSGATPSISYVYVRDSACGNSTQSVTASQTISNGGNNGACWNFISHGGSGGSSGSSSGGGTPSSGGGNTGGSGGSGSGGGDSGSSGGGTPSSGGGQSGGGGGAPAVITIPLETANWLMSLWDWIF